MQTTYDRYFRATCPEAMNETDDEWFQFIVGEIIEVIEGTTNLDYGFTYDEVREFEASHGIPSPTAQKKWARLTYLRSIMGSKNISA